MADRSTIEWTDAAHRAMRMALCKRLRETGMQDGAPCDGDMVQCGCCDRTVKAMIAAANQFPGGAV